MRNNRAAVGEAGEAVRVWFDAVHPLDELRAVTYLDGEGSKHGFTLVGPKLLRSVELPAERHQPVARLSEVTSSTPASLCGFRTA